MQIMLHIGYFRIKFYSRDIETKVLDTLKDVIDCKIEHVYDRVYRVYCDDLYNALFEITCMTDSMKNCNIDLE